jgi:CubicO group peptidase (beta-lactamase class C family)
MGAANRWSAKQRRLVTLGILLVFIIVGFLLLEVGCRVIDLKQHDEYTRPGLDPAVRDLCKQRSQLIPEIMKSRGIPGVSVALVDREGVLWGTGFGFTDYDRKTPVTRDTSFLICSMSKTFVALAVMCAVRDGLIDLDTPITTYLPYFAINSRFEADPQDKITLRHLLNHTSGIPHEAPMGNGYQPSYSSLAEHANSIGSTWLRFPVGAKWDYSGAAYDLVTYILEVQAQQPFADYLEENVLRPLNMPNTTVDKAKIKADRTRAIGHASRHTKKIPLASDIPWVGAGGIYASANDLARFIQFFLNWGTVNGQHLLDEESIMVMYTPSVYRNYGLGVEIWKRSVGHGGAGLGFSSLMVWLPEYGFGGLVLINEIDFNNFHSQHWDWLTDLLRSILDEELIQKIEDSPERPARLEPNDISPPRYQPPDLKTSTPYQESWKQYIGSYEFLLQGWELRNYAKLAVALGYNPNRIKVQEIDGYLCVDGSPVDEYRPGLFFTSAGDYLDFTGSIATWNYVILK